MKKALSLMKYKVTGINTFSGFFNIGLFSIFRSIKLGKYYISEMKLPNKSLQGNVHYWFAPGARSHLHVPGVTGCLQCRPCV